jgi:hypothetical protein
MSDSQPIYDKQGNVIGEKFRNGGFIWTCDKINRMCVGERVNSSLSAGGTDFPTTSDTPTPTIDRLLGKDNKKKNRLRDPNEKSLTELLGGVD